MSKKKSNGKFVDNLIATNEEASKVRKIVSLVILAIVLIIGLSGIAGYFYVKSALKPVDPSSDKEIIVEIPLGSSSSSIASILEENGVIKNAIIYLLYIKLNNESNLQPGSYTFTPSMTLDEITESLQMGKATALYTVTIPEGLTIDQIADIYAKDFYFSKEKFLNVVNDRDFISELMRKYSILPKDILQDEIISPLEGYLFAATYLYYEEKPSIRSIIEGMVSQTQDVVSPYMDQIENSKFSLHEVLTFASLVEKEASNNVQRKEIAGVFYNRLEKGMRLETDPTVAYALGEHLETTLYKHLEVESPYNTYRINGLPIGPIANFSKSSLEAVLQPENSDYVFFLHDHEGKIHYAKTYEEHSENIKKYLN
ncbi:endolytic transglycosylase MltG [Oceanobacillus sp. Castelsardo]|uniref:endolytic transglycosylase MltG n=1 Tax=Oceanobacillus sp. Castelsardo TaxID=1851204 RepID=UPI000837B223|nr:endolytic transglycosylase MltG [Oceanobacillus sp. Castelsardo]